jgi:SAM-dependent methyltransferase
VTRSYANFGIGRSLNQVVGVLRHDPASAASVGALRTWVERDVARIEQRLGHDLSGQRILEIGPGQGLERAHYLGLQNDVEALDLDLAATGFDPRAWMQICRVNGPGRMTKTIGREALVARRLRRRWVDEVGGDGFVFPVRHQGDICQWSNPGEPFDVAVSWSVFEHVAEPREALLAVMRAVRPGGVVMVSIHNYTSFNGHHDIRSFSGSSDERLLWGHLRPSSEGFVDPSAYLNEWRLHQWRELFGEVMPEHDEYIDGPADSERYEALLDGPIGDELTDTYDREELLAVNIVFSCRRPDIVPDA